MNISAWCGSPGGPARRPRSTAFHPVATGVVALLGLLVGMQPGEAGLVTGLSGHWALDDTSGSTAVNAVSGGVNGTIGGGVGNVTIDQPGQVDRAFVFSGGVIATNSNNPRVRLAPDMIPATGQFTVSGWIKSSAPGTSVNGSIFSSRTTNINTFGIDINEAGRFRVLGGWGVTSSSHLTSPSTVNTGEWVHVAASRNAADLVEIYVNGELVGSQTRTGTIDTTPDFFIGNRTGGNTPFTGSLDDIATWTRALSGQELALLGGLGYFAEVGVSDASQIDAVLGMYEAGTGTAVVGGQTWTYAANLGSTTIGARGGSVAANDAFIVLGGDGTGIVIVPEPEAVPLAVVAGLAVAAWAARRRRHHAVVRRDLG